MTKLKAKKKTHYHIGRWFNSEEALFKYLEEKRQMWESEGLIQMEDYFEKYAVLVANNGFLLINNPNTKDAKNSRGKGRTRPVRRS